MARAGSVSGGSGCARRRGGWAGRGASPSGGPGRVGREGETAQPLVWARAAADVPAKVPLGASQPVSLRAAGLDLVEEPIGQKAAIEDGERRLGELGPEGGGRGQ